MTEKAVDLAEVKEQRNRTNAFANRQGLKITEIRDGFVRLEGEVQPWMSNPVGSLHGGYLYTAADAAAGGAASTIGEAVTTVEGTFRYLRAGLGIKRVMAEATIRKKGKTLVFVDVSVIGEKEDGSRTELCEGIYTFMVIPSEFLA